jgi:3-keto-5-aminohexanoate cleavage enzyme
MEDNVRLDATTLAPSNAALVRQLLPHLAEYGRRPATAEQARALLGLAPAGPAT